MLADAELFHTSHLVKKEKIMDDNEKKLKLMRFWLFGTFIIVFVAIVVYAWMWAGFMYGYLVTVLTSTLPIWGITAVLCLLWYFGYSWYLNKK